jgi:hypothetical protein
MYGLALKALVGARIVGRSAQLSVRELHRVVDVVRTCQHGTILVPPRLVAFPVASEHARLSAVEDVRGQILRRGFGSSPIMLPPKRESAVSRIGLVVPDRDSDPVGKRGKDRRPYRGVFHAGANRNAPHPRWRTSCPRRRVRLRQPSHSMLYARNRGHGSISVRHARGDDLRRAAGTWSRAWARSGCSRRLVPVGALALEACVIVSDVLKLLGSRCTSQGPNISPSPGAHLGRVHAPAAPVAVGGLHATGQASRG